MPKVVIKEESAVPKAEAWRAGRSNGGVVWVPAAFNKGSIGISQSGIFYHHSSPAFETENGEKLEPFHGTIIITFA